MRHITLFILAQSLWLLAACGPKAHETHTDHPAATPPGGGLGIPYWTCSGSVTVNCTPGNLDLSGIDPMNNLETKNACEFGWCRAYYVTNKVCLHQDTIKCGKGGAGVQGTATCSNGNWGPCM